QAGGQAEGQVAGGGAPGGSAAAPGPDPRDGWRPNSSKDPEDWVQDAPKTERIKVDRSLGAEPASGGAWRGGGDRRGAAVEGGRPVARDGGGSVVDAVRGGGWAHRIPGAPQHRAGFQAVGGDAGGAGRPRYPHLLRRGCAAGVERQRAPVLLPD